MGLLAKPLIYTSSVWLHDEAQKLVYAEIWGHPNQYYWPWGRAWMYAQFKEGTGAWQDSSKVLLTKFFGGFTKQIFMFYASTTDVTIQVRGAVDYETPLGIWEGTSYGETLSIYIPPATVPQVATGRVRHIENDTVRMTAHGHPGNYGSADLYMQYRKVDDPDWIETDKTTITVLDKDDWDIEVTPEVVYEARAALDYNGTTIYGEIRRTDEPIPEDLACETQPSGAGTAEDPYIITDDCELQWMRNDLSAYYELGNDIDASNTYFWNWDAYEDRFDGFSPIGSPFTGKLDGKDYTIDRLYIRRCGSSDNAALFGGTEAGAEISNLNLTNVDIETAGFGAALVAVSSDTSSPGMIYDSCHASGRVFGGNTAGGLFGRLVGKNNVTKCSSSVDVYAGLIGGGFVGNADGENIVLQIEECYATGNVSCDDRTTGWSGAIYAGGFAAIGGRAEVDRCYASGNVCAYRDSSVNHVYVGGFVGNATGVCKLTDCYSRGSVTGEAPNLYSADWKVYVGGFTGSGGVIDNAYSTGYIVADVSEAATLYVGGFCASGGTITDCFWDVETSGKDTSNGGTGKTTAQMKTTATFTDAGWDFVDIWAISSVINDGYPHLQALPYPPTVTTLPATDVDLDSAVLNGQIGEDGNDTCEYRFRFRKQGNEYYEESLFANSKVADDLFSELITGLKPSTTYEFAAQARNSGGYSAWGETLTFTTKTDTYLPTDSMARVSSIRRIYRPGLYRMEVALGDLGFNADVSEAAIEKVPDEVTEPEKPPEVPPEGPQPGKPVYQPGGFTEEQMMEIIAMQNLVEPTLPPWATKITAPSPYLEIQLEYIGKKFTVTYRGLRGIRGKKTIMAKSAEEAESIVRSQGLRVISVIQG